MRWYMVVEHTSEYHKKYGCADDGTHDHGKEERCIDYKKAIAECERKLGMLSKFIEPKAADMKLISDKPQKKKSCKSVKKCVATRDDPLTHKLHMDCKHKKKGSKIPMNSFLVDDKTMRRLMMRAYRLTQKEIDEFSQKLDVV